LLLGTDTLLTLHDRQGVEDIFRLSYPVYMRREGPDPVLEALIVKQIGMLSAKYNKVVRRITGEALPVSGTQIRRLRATGGSITGLVPASVEQYISDHDLYV
jgi:nicotinic acid mononucleotide adenylyltransferase